MMLAKQIVVTFTIKYFDILHIAIFTCKKMIYSIQLLNIITMNVWEAKEVFLSYDPFCLNGIHETQELRKCSALEYSITNLLRKDKDYLEI